MLANGEEQAGADDASERAIPMDDQGPSYGSSYNESTPSEITQNRRASIREDPAEGAPRTGDAGDEQKGSSE